MATGDAEATHCAVGPVPRDAAASRAVLIGDFDLCFHCGNKQEVNMADEILKDSMGHTIGKISTASNGVQTIKDPRGSTKGTYDPKTNITKDVGGHRVGTGNLLARFL